MIDASAPAPGGAEGPPALGLTVGAAWLAAHLSDPDVRVVDVRWYLLGKKGREEYDRGHVPGAAFVDLETELARGDGKGPGRHPLPEPAAFAALLSRLGVRRDTTVVAYDDAGGIIAARMWWLLDHFGLGTGRVLDGGLAAWIAAGGALVTDVPAFAPAPPLELAPREGDTIEADALAASRGPRLVLLDARAPERFEGRVEPVDPRPGHIPGARSAPTGKNLVGGKFAPPETLREHYAALGALDLDREVVCYCGSGVTACHDILALRMLGRTDVRLYPGSFSEWSADAARSVSRFVG